MSARFVGYVEIKRYVLDTRAVKQDYRHEASACGSDHKVAGHTHMNRQTDTHTHSCLRAKSLCHVPVLISWITGCQHCGFPSG